MDEQVLKSEIMIVTKLHDKMAGIFIKNSESEVSQWLKKEVTLLIDRFDYVLEPWKNDPMFFGWYIWIGATDEKPIDEFILQLKKEHAQYIEMEMREGQAHHYNRDHMKEMPIDILRFFFEQYPEFIKEYRLAGEQINKRGKVQTGHPKAYYRKEDDTFYFTLHNTIDVMVDGQYEEAGTHEHRFILRFVMGKPKDYAVSEKEILTSMTSMRNHYKMLNDKLSQTDSSHATPLRMSIKNYMELVEQTYNNFSYRVGDKTPLIIS